MAGADGGDRAVGRAQTAAAAVMTPERVEDVAEQIAASLRAFGKVWGLAGVRVVTISPDGRRRVTDYAATEVSGQ